MKKSFVVSFGHLMRGDAFGLLDRTASSALDRSAPDSPVSTEELSQRLPGAINITNFTAFDEYFVLEYKNAKSAGFPWDGLRVRKERNATRQSTSSPILWGRWNGLPALKLMK